MCVHVTKIQLLTSGPNFTKLGKDFMSFMDKHSRHLFFYNNKMKIEVT